MIPTLHSSTSRRTAVLAVALATLAAGLADATPVTINVSANPGGVVQVTGDPAVAPLVLPGLGWPPSNGIAPGALFTQDLAQLSLTNLTIGCGVIGGCTYRYDIQTQPLNVAATGLVVRLDGNVSTTNAAGADAWLSLQLYSRANNPNPYDTNVYSLVVPRFESHWSFRHELVPGTDLPCRNTPRTACDRWSHAHVLGYRTRVWRFCDPAGEHGNELQRTAAIRPRRRLIAAPARHWPRGPAGVAEAARVGLA